MTTDIQYEGYLQNRFEIKEKKIIINKVQIKSQDIIIQRH